MNADLVNWIPTAAVSALAFVLWTIGTRIIGRLDAVENLMRTELRTMDVRIARIESHIWPSQYAKPLANP